MRALSTGCAELVELGRHRVEVEGAGDQDIKMASPASRAAITSLDAGRAELGAMKIAARRMFAF